MILTSCREDVFLLDGGVQLERQLRRGAQKSLDDRGAFEGIPVRGQDALRLANFPLHLCPRSLLQLDLSGDGDIRLFLFTCLKIDHQSLKTPEEEREVCVRVSEVMFSHQQRAVRCWV